MGGYFNFASNLCSANIANSDVASKRSLPVTLNQLQLSRSNVNSVMRSYLSPTPVGVGVGTCLIWEVDQTLLSASVWLHETKLGVLFSPLVL